ncbi:MAG: hypothetical protein KKC77_19380 [Proteobacteria bacterium]|nr:hypothetical protein [Pseudomonadota bacterium]
MTKIQVLIDENIHTEVKDFIEVDKSITYRSITHFISAACKKELDRLKGKNL